MLFSQFAERIRSEIERVAALGPRASVTWRTASQAVGQPITVELTVVRNRSIAGEPRQTGETEAVRVWHSQRELIVLCQVFSRAPPVAAKDRGGAYLTSAQEILERITTRLSSNETAAALGPGECSYVQDGDILAVWVSQDGRAVDTASCELVFSYAGEDSEASEGQGQITSVSVTSHLKTEDGSAAPAPWDDHAIPEEA